MRRTLLDRLAGARAAARAAALVTDLSDGAQTLFEPDGASADDGLILDADAAAAVAAMLAAGRSGRLPAPSTLFVQSQLPPLRCLVVGAVHIAQTLVPIAALSGFAVTLIDPRRGWANATRFAGVEICHDWPDDALQRLRPDARSAVITLSHDPKLDDPALAAALRSEAFYLGALGSRKTHAARLERLREQGFDNAQLARIHAPIGLNLGGRSPAEIALATAAQMVQTLYRGDAARAGQ